MEKDDYKQALEVQEACNLSGVVHSFDAILSRLWDEARRLGKGTDWVNTHPICVLFADKISSLTCRSGNCYSEAYEKCLHGGEEDE